jgi:hypothetical protein
MRGIGRWRLRRTAVRRNTSLPASAIVWSVSASSAGDPVSPAAIPFAAAIVEFAARAARTRVTLSSASGAGASGGDAHRAIAPCSDPGAVQRGHLTPEARGAHEAQRADR